MSASERRWLLLRPSHRRSLCGGFRLLAPHSVRSPMSAPVRAAESAAASRFVIDEASKQQNERRT